LNITTKHPAQSNHMTTMKASKRFSFKM